MQEERGRGVCSLFVVLGQLQLERKEGQRQLELGPVSELCV